MGRKEVKKWIRDLEHELNILKSDVGSSSFSEDDEGNHSKENYEKKILELADHFSSFAENSPDIIARYDTEFRYVYCNTAVERFFGKEAEFFIGKKPSDIFDAPEKTEFILSSLREVKKSGKEVNVEQSLLTFHGLRYFLTRIIPEFDQRGDLKSILTITRDITERKLHEDEREETARLISLINTPGSFQERISALTESLQRLSGCEAIGIRFKEDEDFPYYETRGLSSDFIRTENRLCALGPDGKIICDGTGNPIHECMCGTVLCGKTDSTKPFFTPHGSFWSNSTTQLLANTTDDDRMSRTRNRCNGEGYESVALIPLRFGQKVFGLLQFNDPKPNMFSSDIIEHFEKIADSLAIVLSQFQTEKALMESEEKLRFLNTMYSEMLNLPDVDSIYNYVSKKLQERFPDTIVLTCSIDDSGINTQLESYAGIDNELLAKLLNIITFNPVKKSFKLVPGHNDFFNSGKLVEYSGGFAEFTAPEIPAFVAKAIEKLIGLHKIYAIGIKREDNLLASIHLLTFDKKIITESNFIETFVGQVGLVLQKRLAVNALEESEKKLLQLNADKDLLMSVLAHDLKSPFNSLLGFSELLTENVRKYNVEKIENLASYINDTARSTYNLLENLLMWIKSQSGKISFHPQNLDFREICTGILGEFILIAEAKKIRINNGPPERIKIFADEIMLKTVLRNLISNAIKFSKTGGKIEISVKQNSKNTTVKVSDKGIGMSAREISKLFDTSQISSTRGTSNESGTGLGLLICKEFIEKHRGEIHVESNPGRGSDFIFTLPLEGGN